MIQFLMVTSQYCTLLVSYCQYWVLSHIISESIIGKADPAEVGLFKTSISIPAPAPTPILRGGTFNPGLEPPGGYPIAIGGANNGHRGISFNPTPSVPATRQRRWRPVEDLDEDKSWRHSGYLLGASRQRAGLLYLQKMSGKGPLKHPHSSFLGE